MTFTPHPTAPRIFYGWVIVAATGLISMTFYGSWVLFAVFLKPLSIEFGWARGETALAYSLVGLLAGICGIYSGALADRFGTKRLVLIGSLFLGLGLVLTSFITSLWQLYLTYSVILGGLGVGFINVPATSNVPRWFTKNKGLAIGLAMSGTSLGLMTFPAVGRLLIDGFGWRWAAAIMGMVAWSVIIPAAFLLRSHPGPDEIEPERAPRSATPGSATLDSATSNRENAPTAIAYIPLQQRKPVGLLRVAMFCCCICHSIPLVHLVAHATDLGYSNMRAAFILSLVGVFGLTGRICWGVVADRFGGMKIIIICSVLQSFMMLWLVFANELWMFYVYAVFFGIGYGGILPMYPIIAKDVYGPAALGSIIGRMSIGGTGGMAVGGYLGGLFFDVFGSYTPAFLFSFAVGSINLILTIYIFWWTRREFRHIDAPRLVSTPAPAPAST